MSGYTVDPDNLRKYASKLSNQQDTASGISGLVEKADVSEQSWGIVGLFVKDSYTSMLTDLREMFDSMINGFESASNKFDEAAQNYEDSDQSVSQLLGGIKVEIDEASTGR